MKLSDTQLLILSSASQRTDHTALLPANLKKPAAEFADRWRKDQANAFALSILAMGLAVSASAVNPAEANNFVREDVGAI
jgi:hypothetical protein